MAGNNRRGTQSRRSTSSRNHSSRGGNAARTTNTRSSSRTSGNGERNSTKRSGASVAGLIAVVLVLILVIAGVAGALFWTNVKYLYDNTTVIPGVEVEGIDIGGMTRDEAYFALDSKLNEKINELDITIKFGDQYWTYDASNLGASGDISEIIDEAMLYGHRAEQSLGDRIDEAKHVLENPEHFTISFGYDQNSVRQIVETLKVDIDIEAVEPTLTFDKDAGQITSIEDRTALLYNPLKYDTQVNINGAPAEIYEDVNGNYQINAEIFTITEGQSGYVVDVDTTVNAIIADLADDSKANVDIVTIPVEPTLTTDELKDYTSLVYHSKSGIAYTSDTARDTNVATALEAFDGLVIMPGQQVSFNETTGERSSSNGYLQAPGIGQDKGHELVWGGGVCQAATVIFNAAIMSGCTVIDKDSHSWPLYTAADDFGTDARDAMVNWGTSDLIFRNDTEHPIYFDTYVYWKYPDNATWAYCNAYTKLLDDGLSLHYEPRLVETKETPEPVYEALGDREDPFDSDWNWDEELGLLVSKYAPSKPYKYYEVYQQLLDPSGNVAGEQYWYNALYGEITGKYYTKPDPTREEEETDGGVG